MNLDTDYRRTIRWGIGILLVGFGGFLAWAVLAPLDEAVPAPGVVSVESKRKRIDHLTGGIVEKILVREGEVVREGQDLVLLNEVQSRAALNSALSQWRAARVMQARLVAEAQGAKAMQVPAELAQHAAEPEVAAAVRGQQELFRSRRGALEGELKIIRESVHGLETQVHSLEDLRRGREKQVALFQQQLDSFQQLKAQGFVSRNHLLEQERQLSEVQSRQSEDLSNIAGVKAKLADYRMRGAQRVTEYRKEVETQLADVQREVATLGEKLTGQRDTHTRLAIRAPVSGTVVDLAVHTVEGVVKPGDRLMDIVPAGDEMMLEARVAPQYIDRVRAGLPADVHFDAYMSQIERPVIRGSVAVVSADALADARTGESYYAIRVVVPAEERARLRGLQLQPGMQATVMVKTGERSLMVYLVGPLLRRFTGALGER